jgi:hypothetical protein
MMRSSLLSGPPKLSAKSSAPAAATRSRARITFPGVFALVACTVFLASDAKTQQPRGPADESRPQYGVSVSADTVRVGDPFRVVLRVRAPEGSTIVFPEGPDTTGAIQPLDRPVTEILDDTTAFIDESATYRLAAWDVGAQLIELGEMRIQLGTRERRIVIPPQQIFVRSILPADTTLHVPKPQRGIYETLAPPIWPWILLAAAIITGLLLWWWLRRRRRLADDVPREDPLEEAERQFRRVEALDLVAAGERGRHVALMADVARRYLALRIEGAGLPFTTSELVRALRHEGRVPVGRLATLLEEVDLVKFARRPVSAERAVALGEEAKEVVRETEAAVKAREAAEEAARAEAAKRKAA